MMRQTQKSVSQTHIGKSKLRRHEHNEDDSAQLDMDILRNLLAIT